MSPSLHGKYMSINYKIHTKHKYYSGIPSQQHINIVVSGKPGWSWLEEDVAILCAFHAYMYLSHEDEYYAKMQMPQPWEEATQSYNIKLFTLTN